MKVGTVTVSNIRLAEMIGATDKKPLGPYLEMKSKLGGIRYFEVWAGAFRIDMKGPRELKRYVAKRRDHLKAIHFDSLLIFKLERCKKWRKCHRRPRDGYLAA